MQGLRARRLGTDPTGERFALQRVLIGGGDDHLLGVEAVGRPSVVDEVRHRVVLGLVDGIVSFQPAGGAVDVDPLVEHALRADLERAQPAVAEVEDCCGEPIGAKRGVGVGEGGDPDGIGLHEPSGGDDCVAADVIHGAAAHLGHVANVAAVDVVVGEGHVHVADAAQPPERTSARDSDHCGRSEP